MAYWRDIWRIVKSGKSSTYRNADNATVFTDGRNFKALPLSKHEEIVRCMYAEQRQIITNMTGSAPVSAARIRDSARELALPLLDYRPGMVTETIRKLSGGDVVSQAYKEPEYRLSRVGDSFMNTSSNTNVPGQDPSLNNMVSPNLWVDPTEAATVYGQGGITALIINKKSKAIRHNNVRIVNPKIDPKLMDEVNESAQYRTGLANALAEATLTGLVYGGALLVPFFKKDSPLTMAMDMASLLRYDIVGKNCLDRYINLDRNNAIHIPNWNPTSSDFLNPRKYFVPYLGCDVAGQRCARIVPVPQAGFWGTLMTMGWGNSEIQGWYQAVCNYEGVTAAIPSMIRQMSVLVHSYNVDLSNALNGVTSLKDLEENNTLAVREASVNNPVAMDVIGDIKAIERDFTAVAELSRIVRQDVGAKANVPEEKIWSSDRGAFASGDPSQGLNEREWEGVRFIHGELSNRCRTLAMIEIINTLGKDRDVLKALPYTTIEFLSPRIESAESRATVIRDLSESVFQLVASGTALDSALDLVLPYGDDHLSPKAEVIERVHEQQKEMVEREKEKHEMEMDMQRASLKRLEEGGAEQGAGGAAFPAVKPKGESGYSKLEQRKKEKTRGIGARREALQKAQGKKI